MPGESRPRDVRARTPTLTNHGAMPVLPAEPMRPPFRPGQSARPRRRMTDRNESMAKGSGGSAPRRRREESRPPRHPGELHAVGPDSARVAHPSCRGACPGGGAVPDLRPVRRRTIDPARWQDNERIRTIQGGEMQLMQRTWGLGSPTTASCPATGTAISGSRRTSPRSRPGSRSPRSKPMPARATRRPGTRGPGSSAASSTSARRRPARSSATPSPRCASPPSDSTDPAGLLRVQGVLSICQNADCSYAVTVGNIVDLGTVMVGTADHRAACSGTNRARPSTSGARASRPAPSPTRRTTPAGPAVRFKPALHARRTCPSCLSAPRVSGLVDAKFDNVSVNQSALP